MESLDPLLAASFYFSFRRVAPRLRENRNAPYSSPRDKSTGIRHCWHRTNQLFITINTITRVHGLHRHGDTTPAQGSSMLTAKQPEEAEYPRQRNNDGGGELHSAGTLAGTRILARKLGILDKQSWHDLQTGMTRQMSTLNVLASSQQPKQSRQATAWH
jgi:hypothetical protein